MSSFDVKTYNIKVENHPNADKIEIARIGDYQSIIPKGRYKDGDIVAYIPESAVVPDNIISELGLEGKLAGEHKNRVKAVKLRGVLSQGLIYPVQNKDVGVDLAEELGIVKYEPPVPVHMAGDVDNQFGKTLKYDIENYKKYPYIIGQSENVIMTEKLHGTWCCMGFYDYETPIVTSKGLSAQGLAFKIQTPDGEPANKDNLYVRMYRKYFNQLSDVFWAFNPYRKFTPVYVLGEIYGKKIQDLSYDLDEPHFAAFDIYVGKPGEGKFLSYWEMLSALSGIPSVPFLYQGGFTKSILDEYTNGKSTIAGHVREGVVVKVDPPREDVEIGRVMLKSVSDGYLLRKGGTEYE